LKINLVSIPVLDQDKALKFYTEKLGFILNKDVPVGNSDRWLTLVSPEWPDGPEILLEPSPNNFEPSKFYQESLMEAGIPYTQLEVDSVDTEFKRLINQGINFNVEPTEIGPVKIAVFNDTCGNLIQIIEHI